MFPVSREFPPWAQSKFWSCCPVGLATFKRLSQEHSFFGPRARWTYTPPAVIDRLLVYERGHVMCACLCFADNPRGTTYVVIVHPGPHTRFRWPPPCCGSISPFEIRSSSHLCLWLGRNDVQTHTHSHARAHTHTNTNAVMLWYIFTNNFDVSVSVLKATKGTFLLRKIKSRAKWQSWSHTREGGGNSLPVRWLNN